MKVLIVEPGYSPYEADIENTLACEICKYAVLVRVQWY